jgi:DNA end-binding protein Ku
LNAASSARMQAFPCSAFDLAKHIVTQKAADFEPEKFEDQYEEALTELINAKRNGRTIGAKPRPRGENVVDPMDALKRSIASEEAPAKGKKPRKASAGRCCYLLRERSPQ